MSHPALVPPLETRTLPGWPEVYNPSLLDILLLTAGIPLAITAVLALAIMGPSWFRSARAKESGAVDPKVEPIQNK